MAMSPAPSPKLDPIIAYGQSVPVRSSLVVDPDGKILGPTLPTTPRKKDQKNLGIANSGKSAFVADVASGGILYAKAPHDVRSIASLTKLMTALVLVETGGLEGDLTFVEEDFDHESKGVFSVGDTISKRDAVRALLVGSVNAAGAALARTSPLGTDGFVREMNDKARELNLDSMVFVEPTGLQSGNKSSAADVAALLTIVMRNQELKSILDDQQVVVKTVAGKDYKVDSTNLLLNSYLNKQPYKIVGAKTGSLPEAGYCMAQVTRDEDGNQVVAVLLGSDNHFSRYRDIKALTGWAFESYEWPN